MPAKKPSIKKSKGKAPAKRPKREPEPKELIERADWLVRHRRLWSAGDGVWRCFTERAGVDEPYTITAEGCSCYQGENREGDCKHTWAALAPMVVKLIMDMRRAADYLELEHIARNEADEIADAPERFKRRARSEFRMIADALRRAA